LNKATNIYKIKALLPAQISDGTKKMILLVNDDQNQGMGDYNQSISEEGWRGCCCCFDWRLMSEGFGLVKRDEIFTWGGISP